MYFSIIKANESIVFISILCTLEFQMSFIGVGVGKFDLKCIPYF